MSKPHKAILRQAKQRKQLVTFVYFPLPFIQLVQTVLRHLAAIAIIHQVGLSKNSPSAYLHSGISPAQAGPQIFPPCR